MSIDYTSFHLKGERSRNSQLANTNWWEKQGKEMAQAIVAAMEIIAKNQDSRLRQYVIGTRLYGNVNMSGPSGMSFSRLAAVHPALRDKISYNVVQSAIDTIISKTTKNKPKPFFLTSGGDYKEQRRAKKLNKFVEGLFYEQDAYFHGELAMRDGCIWGDGLVHVYQNRQDRVAFRRVLPHEIWVDELDGFYGKPRVLHWAHNVDRDALRAECPEFTSDIDKASIAKPDPQASLSSTSDLITLRESWRLPSSPNADDGIHAVSIDDCVLFTEPWKHDWFPFARFTWWNRPHGFWGQGLAEQIQNIQLEINKLLNIIQRSFHLGGSFKILLENGSKVVKEHLNNDVGAIIMYNGTKPDYIVPPLVPAEIYGHFKTLKDSAYEQAGVSQMSASSKKPEGVESGKALRTINDIESERFISVGHAYERFYMDLARLAVETARDISRRHRGCYSVKVPNRQKFYSEIDWKDIDLDRDSYVMQIYPISSLPNDPAGRMQTVQEYVQAGFLTPRQGKKLLDFPDMERVEGLQSAAEDYIAMTLDKIIDDGEYTPPDRFDDLDTARELALEYFQRGKCSQLEPEKLELLLRFIGQIDAIRKQASDAAAAEQALQASAAQPVVPGAAPSGPGPGMGAPQAVPMPPAASDLINNTPGAPAPINQE